MGVVQYPVRLPRHRAADSHDKSGRRARQRTHDLGMAPSEFSKPWRAPGAWPAAGSMRYWPNGTQPFEPSLLCRRDGKDMLRVTLTTWPWNTAGSFTGHGDFGTTGERATSWRTSRTRW